MTIGPRLSTRVAGPGVVRSGPRDPADRDAPAAVPVGGVAPDDTAVNLDQADPGALHTALAAGEPAAEGDPRRMPGDPGADTQARPMRRIRARRPPRGGT